VATLISHLQLINVLVPPQIEFDRGGLQDFSSDPRVVFNVTDNPELCEVVRSAGGAAEVRVRAGQATCVGSCTVLASFGGLTAEATVAVVSLQVTTSILDATRGVGRLEQQNYYSETRKVR
jgi:hypothetical protein